MAKVNVDDNDSLAAKYEVSILFCLFSLLTIFNYLLTNLNLNQVSSIPTVVAMKNGKTVDQFVGVKDEDEIQTFVDKLLVKN